MTKLNYTPTPKHKMRLDAYLVQEAYFENEAAALRAILAHTVKVDDVYASSAATLVDVRKSTVEVKGGKRFVSRGGFKLKGALEAFSQDVANKRCIDVGSSTGGFTDCLLQAGAKEVVCVDVNYGQLAWQIRQDPRVRIFERTNIKLANPQDLGAPFDLIVADLSFIGLAQLAPTFAALSASDSVFIGLIKPQFESEHHETEHGIVTDEAVHKRVVEEVRTALEHAGFTVTGTVRSSITGAQGNIEFLIHARFGG